MPVHTMTGVLVVDDEPVMRAFLQKALKRQGYEVTLAKDAAEAVAAFAPRRFGLVLTDVNMPGRSGLDLLDDLVKLDPTTPIVLMTAFGSISTAVDAVQRGASDFLTKPIEIPHLKLVLDRTLARRRADSELEELRPYTDEREGLAEMIGRSLPMKRVYTLIDKVAPKDLTVLVLGETGTGKGLCAKAIHQLGPRSKNRFQVVNCSALQETLLESELFGHEKGAFTGADKRKLGHFEVAEGGTLFLDEVGDAPPAVQAKLLRALQEKEIVRVGGTDSIPVDVRIVAATNKDLEAMSRAGEFREDLYYRLSPFPIRMPTLRERLEDIPIIVEAIMAETSPGIELSVEAALALERYDWPGNVRELQNVIQRASVLAGDEAIGLEHLTISGASEEASAPAGGSQTGVPISPDVLDLPLREARQHFERFYVERLLRQATGNVSEAARRAGMGRASLHEKINKLGLDPTRFRP